MKFVTYTEEVIVTYVEYERCGKKESHVANNRGQGVILNMQKWYECSKREERKAMKEAKENLTVTSKGK